MKSLIRLAGNAGFASMMAATALAQPALVGLTGYTNAFTTRPPAAEWSTVSWPGGSQDVYDMNGSVQFLISDYFTQQVLDGGTADPPAPNALAWWTGGGSRYLVTRPTGNRMTLLMVRLQNTTGTNATRVRLAYDLSIKAPATEPDYPGLRAYYSLTATVNSWVAIPEFTSATPLAGTLTANINLVSPWNQNSLLYVIWADDNAASLTPDPGYALDNFSAHIIPDTEARVPLVQSNATWRFIKGLAEASTPIDAWRQLAFDDSSWSNAPAPFFFGDPYSNGVPAFTLLDDMLGNYSSIYLRKKFNVAGASVITNLFFNSQIDDGLVAWINGVEVFRFNAPSGVVPYNGLASGVAQEFTGQGAAYLLAELTDANTYLVDGENVLAVHALNVSLAESSDFGFNAQLLSTVVDPSVIPPTVATVTPASGPLFSLTNITVRFTEGVSGVDAADLLINGILATNVSSTTNTTYTFSFPQPAFGPVAVTWAVGHGIGDFDAPSKSFNATAPGATFTYSLLNPSAPTVGSQSPLAGAAINNLTQLTVSFSEAVTGVDAADLRINGTPASGVSGGPVNYTFTFPQPAYGTVAIGWAENNGITDLEPEPNAFEGTRAGNTWTYPLVDQTPPLITAISPSPGSQVTNLTQVTVTFSEPVTGVEAGDLLVNGVPVTGLSGASAKYTFSFPQLNATLLTFTWINAHGIRDLAPVANSFNHSAPGASWSYITPDTLAPTMTEVSPAPFISVRSLTQLRVTFTEPVTGVDTNDLLVNNVRALSVFGSGAGPYTFNFLPPASGPVNVQWAASHGIRDLTTPTPNTFGGGSWSYILDPSATFAGKVLISELMFNPAGGRPADEWIELRNVTTNAINLTGWHFTRGLEFIFPSVSIPAGGYLVVAADPDAFVATHADVTNVVGGWTGRLADNGETLELATAEGEVVNGVRYASEGDWARRERGHGAALVEGITHSDNTATVALFGHNFTANDRVLISGADQPEYNGLFTVNSPSSATFSITVPGTPVTPATGRIICRQVVDSGQSGWSWFSAADGFGSSLELIHPALPNDMGQNWLTSVTPDGTPGRANSVLSSNVAPSILEVTHFPPVPRSTDSVTISARMADAQSNGVQSVTLFYRNHTTTAPSAFASTSMFDDGAHNDGAAADGLYAAMLGPEGNRTVMEFYVQAMGPTGLIRTWPAPTWETNNTFAQLANALYQVDDESSATNMLFLRLIMTGSERAVFPPADSSSDAEMNATFISLDGDGAQVRYNAGVRIRGAGSRGGDPRNFRVNIPNDHRWNNRSRMNLNSRYVHAQLAGSVLSQRAGLPTEDARVVQVRVNGQNLGSGISFGCYVLAEPMNGDWAANHYPLDPDGNVYRGSKYPWNANLDYQGTNAATYHGQTGGVTTRRPTAMKTTGATCSA